MYPKTSRSDKSNQNIVLSTCIEASEDPMDQDPMDLQKHAPGVF